jgi:hypothetical protein
VGRPIEIWAWLRSRWVDPSESGRASDRGVDLRGVGSRRASSTIASIYPRSCRARSATSRRTLRRLGHYDEAAQRLEEAFAADDGDAVAFSNTTLFLLYDRARLHFERGDVDACLRDIESIQRRQSNPTDYPRLGTLRYEVACRALRGDLAYADELRARAATLRLATPPGPLSQLTDAVGDVDLEDPVGTHADWDRKTLVY